MAIRAVLFDLTGVVTTSPWDDLAAIATDGTDPAAALEFLVGPYDEDTDHLWHRFERGEISATDWFVTCVADAEARGIAVDLGALREVLGRMSVNDVVVDRVRRLRADGLRTALVTNNIREASGAWREMLPVDELFDAVVDSSHVGMRKPNPAIFLHTLAVLGGVEPAEAVFLDDMEGNVAGARRAGLHGILVDGSEPTSALAELDTLLGQ